MLVGLVSLIILPSPPSIILSIHLRNIQVDLSSSKSLQVQQDSKHLEIQQWINYFKPSDHSKSYPIN